jgi:hypothetical protein
MGFPVGSSRLITCRGLVLVMPGRRHGKTVRRTM